MVDNINANKPLASVSSAKRVKPVGHRQNNNQQNLFKDTFKDRQKKKKEDPMRVKISGRSFTVGEALLTRHAVANKNFKEPSQKKIIDIMV